MPAVLDRPVCVAPGARAPLVAPLPFWVCPECDNGPAADPDIEAPCQACSGRGFQHADFLLGETATYGWRRAHYNPVRGLLTITTAKRSGLTEAVQAYSVQERPCDWPGRAFLVAKHGSDRLHEVYVGPDGVQCSCEGHTYVTSAKCNQKAFDRGEQTFATHGCCHTDALAALVAGGWFDLGSQE